MQYLRVVSRLEYQNDALAAHGGLYYTVGLYEDIDLKQPQAREDNYLVLLGFFLIVETTDIIQWILANPFLVFIGRRSFSKQSPTLLPLFLAIGVICSRGGHMTGLCEC